MGRDKEKKERIRDHHSWLQLDPAGVSRVLEHTWSKCTGLSGSSLVEISFPHPGNKFCFPCKIVTMCSLFFQIFLEMGWEALGSLVVSIPPPPTVLAHFSTSFLHFCCTVLCLSPGIRSRTFVPEKCCPISSHILFFLTVWYYLHSLCVKTNNPWLGPQTFSYQCLRHIH